MPDTHHGASDTPHDQHAVEQLGYEARDIIGNRRSIFYYALMHFGLIVIAAVVTIATMFAVYKYFPAYSGTEGKVNPVVTDAAKVQSDPMVDMDRMHHDNEERLHSFGWSDEAAGKVHVPIDRAIEEVAAENLPHRPEGTQ